jgi:PiT family inorganic phosphate transporter
MIRVAQHSAIRRGYGMAENTWNIRKVEKGLLVNRGELFRLGTAILFIVLIMLFAMARGPGGPGGTLLVMAAMIGGYMALNIGANDVANNVGPAVGSHAITLTGAIVIAAMFEASGALVAGGDVVGTIKSGIIDPAMIGDADTFIWLMMAGLLAAALWLNFATAVGAPVSTTHSIVGGVLGAGVAAGGWGIADWGVVGTIAASWVISPVLGGVIAATFLYIIKRTITYQPDLLAAARRMAPILIAVMAWSFATYLMLKGLNKILPVGFPVASLIGLVAAAIFWVAMRRHVEKAAPGLTNDKEGVNALFTVPLIFAAALLSFAHGANDVANAVGPLAGIAEAVVHGDIAGKAPIPLWVMLVGAAGIALGLALYGPKLIRTVGSEITELDKARAFCVALAAAITVIIASQLGLPVSSTHIAVGGVFGVGFLREYLKVSYSRKIADIRAHHREGRHAPRAEIGGNGRGARAVRAQGPAEDPADRTGQAHAAASDRGGVGGHGSRGGAAGGDDLLHDPGSASAMTGAAPVLCAVDFSADSEAALLWAAAQAQRSGAPLAVLHVVHDPASSPGFYRKPDEGWLRPMEEVAGEMFTEFMEGMRARHPEAAGLAGAERILVDGLPSGRICEIADRIGAGQVVVGSRGRTGLPHVMLGSVAERVAQVCAVPVTVVKARDGAEK